VVSSLGWGLAGLVEQVELAVDSQKVTEVIGILEESVTEIQQRPVEPIAPASFGTLPAATDLGHHTALARDTVVEALQDVLAGLRVYADNVDNYRRDVIGTDEVVGTSFAPIRSATDCIGGGFADQNDRSLPQCTVPGGSDS